MDFTNEFQVEAPAATVWDFFENEAETVGMCIPGAELIEQTGEDRYRLIVNQKVGHLKAKFELDASVAERQAPALIRLDAKGKSVKGARTSVQALATVRLDEVAGATSVSVDASVTLTGVAASLGRKVLAKRTAEVIAEFAVALQRSIGSVDVDDQTQ